MPIDLDTSKPSRELKPDKCEWNFYDDRPAVTDDGKHIGCQREATIGVGANGLWHLCDLCAALPRFKRLKKTPLRPVQAKGIING